MKQNISGIYAIVNKTNGKRYVGSSKHVHYRWKQDHTPLLKSGNHYNRHLQAAWNKYGADSFEFQVIEECGLDKLLEREGHYIEQFKSWERESGYNLTRVVDGKQVFSEETCFAMAETRRIKEENTDYWTTGTNAKILELYNAGKSKNGIAKELGITRSCVYTCLEQNGLHVVDHEKGKLKLTDEVKQQIQGLRDQKKSWEEISEQLNISKTQLYRTELANDGKYSGDKRDNFRTVTTEVIAKAKELRGNTTMTWDQVAEELGVSRFALHANGVTKDCKPLSKKVPKNKLTDELKMEINRMKENGVLIPSISSSIGVAQSTIRYYLKS